MKLSLVLRNKKNALKLSTKSLESFIERIKTDTKDGAVVRRRRQLGYGDHIIGYDSQYPSHLIYPSAVFEKDDNDNLRMKTFNGVVALTIDGLENQTDIDAVKRAAQILHYTLAAFVGPSGREVIILVRIAKAEDASPAITQPYSEITQPYSEISGPYSEISGPYSEITHPYSQISGTYLTEEEADALCQEGHRMAAAIYQAIMPKPILKEPVSVRSCFRMPLDPEPYYNPKALALPVRESGGQIHDSQASLQNFATIPSDSTESSPDSDISRETMQLVDFLNQRYQFRYNTIMGYTEYKDNDYRYMDWTPVDDRTLKGMTMKVRLGGIDARDNDVRRYVQSNMIRPFNPIGDYLWAQYYKWDGKDHIRKLARTVPNRNPHWEDWFYTWFLGMVDYFEPARNEQEGEWLSASAILAYLKDEVGVSLLKSPSVPAFGRKLSAIPGMQKRVTSINTFYLVRKIR